MSLDSKLTALEIKAARHMKRARIGGYVAVGVAVVAVCASVAFVANAPFPGSKPSEQFPALVEAPARPVPPGYAVIEMPNSYDNMITFCNYGNRVYKTLGERQGQAIHVVVGDPSCAGK